jgi:hypothetical protein
MRQLCALRQESGVQELQNGTTVSGGVDGGFPLPCDEEFESE